MNKLVNGALVPLTQVELDQRVLDQEVYEAEQIELAKTKYQRDRAEAYPSLNEQADMAYWDRQNNTTTLDDAISAVKTTYPKPGV